MKHVNISSSLEAKFRQNYINDHSKFIHASWLLKEDLDKKSVINGTEWTIVGLWDLAGTRRLILLKSERGSYAFEDSKIVSEGMGFFNMRNQVTGVEHKNWYFKGSDKVILTALPPEETADTSKDEVEETSGIWTQFDKETVVEDEDQVEDDEEIDPLVQALREDISDDDPF
jgi:hypothetical protein